MLQTIYQPKNEILGFLWVYKNLDSWVKCSQEQYILLTKEDEQNLYTLYDNEDRYISQLKGSQQDIQLLNNLVCEEFIKTYFTLKDTYRQIIAKQNYKTNILHIKGLPELRITNTKSYELEDEIIAGVHNSEILVVDTMLVYSKYIPTTLEGVKIDTNSPEFFDLIAEGYLDEVLL